MKFGNDANRGKQSIPGRPVLWRRHGSGPIGLIGQEGEAASRGLRGLGRSTGRSEVRPRVQPRNPGAPGQAPKDLMIPDYYDRLKFLFARLERTYL